MKGEPGEEATMLITQLSNHKKDATPYKISYVIRTCIFSP